MEDFVEMLIMELFIKQPMFWILIIFAVLSTIFYKKISGFMGEFWVKTELRKLPKDKYIILNDILIKSSKGTHQIDHIVISKFGIFVIEMKNYDGLITGDEYKENWTQHFGKKKYYFNNPFHQNYGHIMALQEILNIDKNNFISIVCVSNKAKLKVNSKKIVQTEYINDMIMSYQKEMLDIDLNEIKGKIEQKNIIEKKARANHVKCIKSNIKKNEIKEKNMICPKCGNELIKRNGKYGEFIGCQSYPKCRYTKDIVK